MPDPISVPPAPPTTLTAETVPAPAAAPPPERPPREVVAATRPFAAERVAASWWCLLSTLLAIAATLTLAGGLPWWPARLAAALLGGLLMVRGFILYHDFMHGALLRSSRLAAVLLHAYGWLLLIPARSWRASHNYHHANVGKVAGSHIGSFPLMTLREWRQATRCKRSVYRVSRHPLIILLAYPVIFAGNIALLPLLKQPGRHWDSAVALAAHAGTIAALWWLGGFATAFFAFLLPVTVAATLGAYLFYAQHSYPGMRILAPSAWTSYEAALASCSYLRMGRVMRWFTGDIGFHHVHHLSSAIPFYRLHEAMAAVPELQHPVATTLRPRDIAACLRLKLWDEETGTMLTWREARQRLAGPLPPISGDSAGDRGGCLHAGGTGG